MPTTSSSATISRRRFLGITATGVAGSLAGCYATGGSNSGQIAGGGVGSGFAYQKPAVTKSDATHVARNADQLDAALDSATPEQPAVVWIPPDGAINYTGRTRRITNAVIASSRSVNHPGGIIYTNSMGVDSAAYNGGDPDGMFEFGDQSRITGVRLRGPTARVWDSRWASGFIPFASGGPQVRENYREARFARGITITSGSVRLDNIECYGWNTQGIFVACPRSYGVDREQSYPRLEAASIHDCCLLGYGYGVEIEHGHLIARRVFTNATRHAFAGFGWPDGGYSLINSFIGPANLLFSCDFHYLGENGGSGSDRSAYGYSYHSGGLIRIIGCTFSYDHVMNIAPSPSISAGGNPFAGNSTPAISIGGLPDQKCVVRGNWFAHSDLNSAISQARTPAHAETGPHGFARFEISNNKYGVQFPYPVGQG